ncbi:hypothetical protein D7X74_12925 [Corallococcus sp. CA047B]|uniref:hypothetical protein n=1 Tax=Corallococcus sp. CA047B TaxID=2316729 RepID=UPI000EE5B30A|nr:hypothetical protein [Corallococcus sp. CA047B]RKH17307.1 hypothetical protein D7X74_12925 [Corallococcus sp. CA047B]
MNRLLPAVLLALLGAGCFDPLYEDLDPLGEVTWAVCCVSGQVDTCRCESPDGCPAAFRACAEGTCAESLSQSCGGFGTDGGMEQSRDAGTGVNTDAGTSTDGGISIDAGTSTDAGTDGGTDAGPMDAGPGDPGTAYGPCCNPTTHKVTTCACPASGCANPPFTPCAASRCALEGERC